MDAGYRRGWCGLVKLGVVLSSIAMAATATAGATLPPDYYETSSVSLSLADDAQSQRWYSRVPSDSPVLLPLKQQSSNGVWNDVSWLRASDVPLTVDGDPVGRVTGVGWLGEAGFGLVWTPTAVREPGRTTTARLAAKSYSERWRSSGTFVDFEESTFEFSYIEATSAEFLPSVELELLDFEPEYSFVGAKCCEVVASRCSGAASCHQCWELEGELWVGGAWDGPGMPYLTFSLRPASTDNLLPTAAQNAFQITGRGEVCIEGTAAAAGETRTVIACGIPSAPPVDEATGLQPVLADSCRVLPEGVYPTTALVAVRSETEAQARESLDRQGLPQPTPTSEASADYGVFPGCATARGAPPASSVLTTLGLLTVLVTLARRRRS